MPRRKIDTNLETVTESPTPSIPEGFGFDFNRAKQKGSTGKKALIWTLLILLVVVGLGGWYWYSRSHTKNNESAVSQDDPNREFNQLKAIAVVPEGETPKVFLVSDAETTRKQEPLLSEVENGDKVYVYSGKAYIYRPSSSKLVAIIAIPGTKASASTNVNTNVSSNTNSNSNTSTNTNSNNNTNSNTNTNTSTTSKLSVEVRNGTNTAGLAAKAKATLEAGKLTVVKTGNAVNKDYTTTYIVNPNSLDVASISKLFPGAKVVTTMPEGETKLDASANVLVIVVEK